MAIQLSSKNIFLSTHPSGKLGSGQLDTLNRFRMCLNNTPLQTTNDSYGVLSLVDFNMYRNFYYINKYNNKIHYSYTHGGNDYSGSFTLTSKDYETLKEITDEFQTQLIEVFKKTGAAPGGGPNITFTAATGNLPPSNYTKSTTGFGILQTQIDLNTHGVTELKLTCRNYNEGDINDLNSSYELLGAKRISSSTDTLDQSFDVTISTNNIIVKGYYPMQLNTTPYIYLRCSEAIVNLASENYSKAVHTSDTHIINSTLLCKIPVNDEVIAINSDMSTPHFIRTDNKNISSIMFHLCDSHGRELPEVADDQATLGNLSCEMTINWSTYTKPTSQPINNNVELNNIRQGLTLQRIS
jgi:hypothetical protein